MVRGRFAPDLFAVDAGRVLDVGTVLPGGFCVSGLLGRGSLADVYAVTAPSGQTLALKMLHEQMASDPSLLARFSMEADLLARISHPAVIGYRTRGAWGRRPFLVMERAAGHDLALELSRHAPLCATRVVGIGCGVLDGLIALHANGIVHRDIKPANVFVSAGETPRVQLIDLGSATRIGTEGRVAGFDQDRLTPFGHTMVTPHYASPRCRC